MVNFSGTVLSFPVTGIYPGMDAIYLDSFEDAQDDQIWSLPSGFQCLSSMSLDPHLISWLKGGMDEVVEPGKQPSAEEAMASRIFCRLCMN